MAISPKAQEMFDAYNNLDVRKKVKAYAKEFIKVETEQSNANDKYNTEKKEICEAIKESTGLSPAAFKKIIAQAKLTPEQVEMIDEEQDIIQSFAEAINDNGK